MGPKQILVLGGGFAGLWSAVGAVRKLDELGIGPDRVEVKLVNRDAFHSVRVRNYEADLTDVRVPLDDVLGPIGVSRVEADVVDLDLTARRVAVLAADQRERLLSFDRLVFALGSQLVRPELPGLAEFAFDVDTYAAAQRLSVHLRSLAARPPTPGRYGAIVVGAGLTGIEVATELASRLRALAEPTVRSRVVLVDHSAQVGSDMGESARPVLQRALTELGIESRTSVGVTAITSEGVTLSSGETITASTVVWCAGMRANRLTAKFPVERDSWGRLPIDVSLKVIGVPHVLAAGDAAVGIMDGCHRSVMSCQHSRPMGRFAGHNVVADLLDLPLLPLHIDWYVTVLDLGAAGALYTEGWEREVVATGQRAKQTKQTINCRRIYPPRTRDRAQILAAAAPVVQGRPQ